MISANYKLPIKLFIAYLVATLVIFIAGPWPWPTQGDPWLYIYMTVVLIGIYLGYSRGLKVTPGGYFSRISVRAIFRLSVVLNLALLIPTLAWRTSGMSFAETLLDPGAAYYASHSVDDILYGKTAWVEYLRILFSANMLVATPILIVQWEKLSGWERTVGVLVVLGDASLAIATGTNKGIGDILVFVFWSALLRTNGHVEKRAIKRIVLVALPIAIVLSFFFTQGQIHRYDGGEVASTIAAGNITVDRDHPAIRYLPPVVKEGAIAFTFYLVQGYHGLALSMEQPFVFTWGVGNSRFLTTYVDKYLGTDIEYDTYPMRTEMNAGWNSKRYWQTIFPWLASDVTFVGAVVVISICGYVMAVAWKDSIWSRNPFAMSLFCQLALMFVFIPANNQVLQSGFGFFGFFLTIFLWLYTRRKRRVSIR